MPITRPWLSTTFLGLAAAAASLASAAGFGAGAPGAVLGQPLDFAVQVRLDPGESLTPDCVSAEVTAGDRRLPAGQVRTVVDAQGADVARVRVLTLQGLDEPVIGISLSVGCSSRMTRQFVVLADPPVLAPVLAPAPTVSAPALAAAPSEATAPPLAAAASSQAASPTSPSPDTSAPAAAGNPRLRSATAGAVAAAATQGVARSAAKPRPLVRATPRSPQRARARGPEGASKRPVATVAAATAAAAAPAPRLKLDLLETSTGVGSAATATASVEEAVLDQALQAVAQAASAARAAASAASAAAERIAGLERTVDRAREEARSSHELATQMRARLAQAGDAGTWLWPLLALALLLAALAAWLAWRMARLQAEQRQGWRQAAAPAPGPGDMTPSKMPTAPIPFVTSEIRLAPDTLPARPRPGPAWPPAAPADNWTKPSEPPRAGARLGALDDPQGHARSDVRTEASIMARTEPRRHAPVDTTVLSHLVPRRDDDAQPIDEHRQDAPMQRTELLPQPGRGDDNASRDVSIEELIDLEQQAEFFVVLGQDDAAIDLLVDHLRNTGGGSPLPYLKLLEIHHRRGDKAAYERMRTRFNHRFNAYAPEWDVGELGLHGGRSLEDYAGIVPRLQQVWSRPLDAMAELEALLFRKSRGELFDLPAYREVLFLYSLARDLLDREAADTGNVDLLLPLSDGGEFSATAPSPFLGLDRTRTDERLDFDTRPTSPVDFDLTAAELPTSIFDKLDDKPHRRPS